MHIAGAITARSHASSYPESKPVIPAQLSQRLDASQHDDDDEAREPRDDKDDKEPPSTANRFPYPSEYGQEYVVSAGILVLLLLLVGHWPWSSHHAHPHDKDRKTLHTKLVDSYALGLLAYGNFESPSFVAVSCL